MVSFDLISPLDFRYFSKPELFGKIKNHLTESAFVRFQLQVEFAVVQGFANRGLCDQGVVEEVRKACELVSPEEVYEEDRRIKHYTRALVNCIRKRVSSKARPFVHLTLTSFDVFDTANALRYKEFTQLVLVQELLNLEKTVMDIALREKDTLQVGRTHGQHAVPITFGFAMAEFVARLGESIVALKHCAGNMRGKLSGAVGAYNAQSLLFDDPQQFEREVLALLGLKPGTHSTQIVEPEFLVDLVAALVEAFGVLANLADDLRHLQRSEIGEVAEVFDAQQVGSSTMPHKRNPWNFENVKSMYKEFMPRMVTLHLDQISEHQRDLTNSASSRFVPEIFAGFLESVVRMNERLQKLVVDKEAMEKNFNQGKEMVVAEPLYILLALHDHPDAHEYVRKKTLEAQSLKVSLSALVFADPDAAAVISKLTARQKDILQSPEKYVGVASKKTEDVCNFWKKELGL